MMVKKSVLWLLVILTPGLLAGCAGVESISDPPRVNLVNLKPVDFQLFEQRYRVTLRVQNPNDRALNIRGMSYEIELDGKEFGHGVSNEAVEVPAYGEALVSVDVVSSTVSLIEQIRALQSKKEFRIQYGIRGKLSVDGVLGKIPFEHEDEISLPGSTGSGSGSSV